MSVASSSNSTKFWDLEISIVQDTICLFFVGLLSFEILKMALSRFDTNTDQGKSLHFTWSRLLTN